MFDGVLNPLSLKCCFGSADFGAPLRLQDARAAERCPVFL